MTQNFFLVKSYKEEYGETFSFPIIKIDGSVCVCVRVNGLIMSCMHIQIEPILVV